VAQKLVGPEVPRRVLYRLEEAVVLLGLSRSQLYELIRSGRLQRLSHESGVSRGCLDWLKGWILLWGSTF
jgi:hypothetical protein